MDRDIIETLYGFAQAYPTDIFPEVTPELDQTAVTRGAASMGRHCAKFMKEGADELIKVRAERDQALDLLRAIVTSDDVVHVCGWYDEIKAAEAFLTKDS